MESKICNTKEEFIKKAREVHGDKFDYSKVDFKGITKPVIITCPIHGNFSQAPKEHLRGCGCSKSYGHYKHTTEEFVERAKKLFPQYDYSKVIYEGSGKKVTLVCPVHGDFLIRPCTIIRGCGCNACGAKEAQKKNRMKPSDFLLKAREVHGWKYDYSKAEYTNTGTKVCIICPEHGEFWQTPHHHLNGSGCPECGRNDLTEIKLYEDIKKQFPDAIHTYKPKFLNTTGKPQSLDIFIPSLNTAIEYQGRQHFVPISRYGGEEELVKTKERDERKYLLCKENRVRLLYISFEKEAPESYLGTIYKDKESLIEALCFNDRHS